MTARRRIALISTGGTIAMEGAHAFDWLNYGGNGRINPVDEILKSLDLGLEGLDVSPVSLKSLPSTGITPADWRDLAQNIRATLTADASIEGVVVTHGTATLEETAFFMHLVHGAQQPVILTGAQRPPNTASSDAVANLRAALIAAADLRLQGAGCLVCFNQALHEASDVTKTSNFSLDAFRSPHLGPLGHFGPSGALTLRRAPDPALRGAFAQFDAGASLPRVDIVFSYAGADGTAVRAFVSAGARGLVSIGFPPGRSANQERAALEKAAADGLLVIQCSRALDDHVPEQPYNMRAGVLSGGGLAANKVRILAMLALGAQMPSADLQHMLLTFS